MDSGHLRGKLEVRKGFVLLVKLTLTLVLGLIYNRVIPALEDALSFTAIYLIYWRTFHILYLQAWSVD